MSDERAENWMLKFSRAYKKNRICMIDKVGRISRMNDKILPDPSA